MSTVYLDQVDQDRLSKLKPYVAKDGGLSRAEVRSNVNINFYLSYGPDFSERTAAHISVDPVAHYESLLQSLQRMPSVVFKNNRDTLATQPVGDELVCTIRHDVDGDIQAAMQQAEIEARLGIPTTFHLLHTAPYYGVFIGDVFVRNICMAEDYLKLQRLGHEIAMHTDGMTLYQSNSMDGAGAVREELNWLRGIGCDVRGTTAHNSFSVYGCNNYSVFSGRPLAINKPAGPRGVVHNGMWAPLQILSEAELGLEYEANDIFWQDQTPVFYGCLMSQNNWYMAHNHYGFLSPDTKESREPMKAFYGTQDDLVDAITSLNGPCYVNLIVHPMHYGLRHSGDADPWHVSDNVGSDVGKVRVWAGGGDPSEPTHGALTCLNEFATPDRGLAAYESADFRIAAFGFENLGTSTVSADSKYTQVAARLLRGPIARPTANAIGVAANNEVDAVGFFASSLETISKVVEPDLVLISIPVDREGIDLIDWANKVAEQMAHVIVLVESTTVEPSEELCARAAEISDRLTCDVFDASQSLSEYEGAAALTWSPAGDLWTPQAHAIVGKGLAACIAERVKSMPPTSKQVD